MEFKDKQSIYLQIADYICEQVVLKKWIKNERIPSVRDLAASIEVNPNTVMRAYEFLQAKDIIYNKRGIGYFTGEDAEKQIIAYRRERFLETELPGFFKSLYLLGLDMKDLQQRYEKYVENTYSNTKKYDENK